MPKRQLLPSHKIHDSNNSTPSTLPKRSKDFQNFSGLIHLEEFTYEQFRLNPLNTIVRSTPFQGLTRL